MVLIDGDGHDQGDDPRIAATRWIPANIDPAYWTKQWRSGDTLITVMPPRNNTILRDALARDSVIKRFLERR